MNNIAATKAFGTNNGGVSVWELVYLRLEQHLSATEAFGANSEDVSWLRMSSGATLFIVHLLSLASLATHRIIP